MKLKSKNLLLSLNEKLLMFIDSPSKKQEAFGEIELLFNKITDVLYDEFIPTIPARDMFSIAVFLYEIAQAAYKNPLRNSSEEIKRMKILKELISKILRNKTLKDDTLQYKKFKSIEKINNIEIYTLQKNLLYILINLLYDNN